MRRCREMMLIYGGDGSEGPQPANPPPIIIITQQRLSAAAQQSFALLWCVSSCRKAALVVFHSL